MAKQLQLRRSEQSRWVSILYLTSVGHFNGSDYVFDCIFIVCLLASRYPDCHLRSPLLIRPESWRPVHESNDLDICTSIVLNPCQIQRCLQARPMELMHTSSAFDIPHTSVMITISMCMYLLDYLSQHENWRLQSQSHHVVQLWTYATKSIVCRFITSTAKLWHS